MHLTPKQADHLYRHLFDYLAGILLVLVAASCATDGLGVGTTLILLCEVASAIVFVRRIA